VPLKVAVAESLVNQVDSTFTPGANRSLHGPKFENVASSSNRSLAATVIAADTRLGL